MADKVRYGIQIGAVDREGAGDPDLYHEAVVDARLTQQLGYDAAWLVEHHFSDYYPTPNPLMFLSHLAAECPGLGLGTAVMVLPWYDPVRFVEDVSMLATMATGPLYIGMGRGTAKLEYDAMRISMTEARDRFRECWEVTQLGLQGKPFTYQGQFVSIDRPIRIRPEIDARRKIEFFGAIGSPGSAEIMADLGLRPLTLAQFPDHMLVKILDRWSARNADVGKATPDIMPISAKCFIADTDEQARDEARGYLAAFYKLQAEHYTTDSTPWGDIPGYEQFAKIFANMKLMGDPSQNDPIIDRSLVGSPETVARRVNELRAIGFNYMLISNAMAGVPRDVRHRMMRRFAEEVIPLCEKMPVPERPVLEVRAAE
ncbi:MAG: LLM class flavin-dependent oxidoreductase [Alphaproteobacteria bacterium]|nr:LLM class flavin-dependent oxidoreductase [Alphaproteobacteria bacterium]